MSTYDFGVGQSVTPYNFQMPVGSGNAWDYSALNSYGQGATPTFGANTSGLVMGGASKGLLDGSGLGLNLPTLELGLKGIGSLASLYTGISALGLAKDQFNFQKAMADKNYTNSVSNYNTALEDKANGRASVTGQSAADTAAYIAAHKLA